LSEMTDFDHLEDLAEIERELRGLVSQTQKQTRAKDLEIKKIKDGIRGSKKSERKIKRHSNLFD